MNRFVPASVLFAVVMSSCSGTSDQVPNTSGQAVARSVRTESEVLRVALPPAPFSGEVSLLSKDSTPQLNLDPSTGPPPSYAPLLAQSQRRGTESYNPSDDGGGQTGFEMSGGAGYTGIYTIHTAYTSSQISLNAPPDNTYPFDTLYAPTARGADGDCYENGSDYWRQYGSSATSAVFRVENFCVSGSPFVLAKSMDSTFTSAYVRYVGNGTTPTYTTESVKLSDGNWHALLYNYNTSMRCREAGVQPSMGSVGDCYDNAVCESSNATLECELLARHRFKTQREASLAIFDFVEGFYNPHRRHSALGYLSPNNYERRMSSAA